MHAATAPEWSMSKRKIRLVVLALLVLAPVVRAQDTASLRARLQTRLDALLAGSNTPGASAAVVLPSGEIVAVASGFADTVSKERMTPAGRLPSGSTGKTFVAAIILQLVDEGRSQLDAPISTWFGKDAWFARLANHSDITVRMLLNHTSGIPDHVTQPAFVHAVLDAPDRVWKPEECVAYILDHPPQSRAGAEFHYTDTNYILLGMIIERIKHDTYYGELQRRLLGPLKLTDIVPNDRRRVPGVVQGYSGGLERSWLAYGHETADAPPPAGSAAAANAMLDHGAFVVNPQFEWTGGGVSTTPTDLARWAKAAYEGRAFPARLLKEAVACAPSGPHQACYGLGVGVRNSPLGVRYGHGGFFPGYSTSMAYFPDHHVAVVIQTNTTAADAHSFSDEFVLDAARMATEPSSRVSRAR
jgi:D-alanyl-D-alanine carboxypeptidase